jgi:predicted RNA-binding protein YlqC (UPF0109 family)
MSPRSSNDCNKARNRPIPFATSLRKLMSSNKSVPETRPQNSDEPVTPLPSTEGDRPDYLGLLRFLVSPFLESPESLRVDCERLQNQSKVWLRMAFDDPEKGRVYGRGGRNIQAIRKVLDATARLAGESVYLDIYGSESHDRPSSGGRGGDRQSPKPGSRRSSSRRSPAPPERPRPSKPQ